MSKWQAMGVALATGVVIGWLAYGVVIVTSLALGGTDVIKPGEVGANTAVLALLFGGFLGGRKVYRRLRARVTAQ